jgi:acyl carrier protein
MENTEILNQLTPIFHKIFDRNDIILTPETSAADIEEWESITHIQLIVAIEKHFKIKFSAINMRSFKNVGGLVEAIKSKLP